MEQIDGATIKLKANVYFDGKVVSHTVMKGGKKQTVGLIYPGAYKFNTDAPERMDVVAGTCKVKLAGAKDFTAFGAGTFFKVPGKSSFEIAVDSGITEYLCTFE
jgi:purine/pyrimidine-nucleoside phosphorylase